jgi:hypothetical protein
LFAGHVTGLLDKAISVDLVPEGLLPRVELGIDHSDKIPVLLEVEEVDTAVIKLLEFRLGEIEKSLQVAESVRFLDHGGGLLVVLVNLFISTGDVFGGGTSDVVGAVGAELLAEVIDLKTEHANVGFDVLSFLLLDGEDASLDGSECLLSNIRQVSLDVLENNKEVLVGLHVDEMLLQEHDGLLHGLNTCNGVFGDHFNITKVLHDLHESVLFSLGLTALGKVLNALLDSLNEDLNVADLGGSVCEKELRNCTPL